MYAQFTLVRREGVNQAHFLVYLCSQKWDQGVDLQAFMCTNVCFHAFTLGSTTNYFAKTDVGATYMSVNHPLLPSVLLICKLNLQIVHVGALH